MKIVNVLLGTLFLALAALCVVWVSGVLNAPVVRITDAKNVAARVPPTPRTLAANNAPSLADILQRTHYHLLDGDAAKYMPEDFAKARARMSQERVVSGGSGGGRKRDAANQLLNPYIVPFGAMQSKVWYAQNYLFTSLRPYQSHFVVHPYAFTYTDPMSGTKYPFGDGVVFDVKAETAIKNMYNLYANSSVNFGKAHAIYDSHIAVLKVEARYQGQFKDLTYESDYFCGVFKDYLGKFGQCLTSDTFRSSYLTSSTSQLVFITQNSLDLLTNNSTRLPRFRLLIIPDLVMGAEDTVVSLLGTTGVNLIKQFMSTQGCTVYFSGKSAAMLQNAAFAVMPTNTFNKNYVLYSSHASTIARTVGCENAAAADAYTQNDAQHIKSLLCFSVNDAFGQRNTYILSPYMMNNNGGFNVITSFVNDTWLQKKDSTYGIPTTLSAADRNTLYMLLHKTYGKGNIIINQANPVFNGAYYQWMFNAVILALSKEYILDASVGFTDKTIPIPGNEAEIVLDVNLNFRNLYDAPLTNFKAYLWLANYFSLVSLSPSANCAVGSAGSLVPSDSRTNLTTCWVCNFDTIDKFSSSLVVMRVEIVDGAATRAANNILVVYPIVSYVYSRTLRQELYDTGGILTNAQMSAYVRGYINPDPIGFYPLHGKGDYIDNVVPIENKENSDAVDVEFIGIVPIVSPLVDGSDQLSTAKLIYFWPGYYNLSVNKHGEYPFPFTKTTPSRDCDFIDFNFLKGKDALLASDWDTPVKNYKVQKDTTWPDYVPGDIDVGSGGAKSTNDKSQIAMQQVFFPDSDNFYEHATQRQLVFVDTTKVNGSLRLWPSGVDAYHKNPNTPLQITKKEYVWVKTDVFFWDEDMYTLPIGVNRSYVLSIDRYPKLADPCVPVFGNAHSKKQVFGYFDKSQPGGLKANEWSNELLMYCSKQKLAFEDIGTSMPGVKVSKYLVPIVDDSIQAASDIMNFDTTSGCLIGYPEVCFIRGHNMPISLEPLISRKGGYIKTTLPPTCTFTTTSDPVASSYITYSADQISFIKTTYDSAANVVYSYFRRGQMPDQAWGKPSKLSINFQGLSCAADFTPTIDLYELKYDISHPENNFEYYPKRDTRQLTATYTRFFSLPSLEMRFKLNRGSDSVGGTNTKLLAYESMKPFVRFGVYYQEILGHRTVYGIDEVHHVTDPGLTSESSGFAVISNIGISSVPFREYVNTGKSLMIPSSQSTSRMEWKDQWGRLFAEPMRSVFPDVPPIPPPIRNFMMTSTFEIINKTTGARLSQWYSEEAVDIRIHTKLLNNYPKYFQITTCKQNEKITLAKDFVGDRIFDNMLPVKEIPSLPTTDYDLLSGSLAYYGDCWNSDKSIMSSKYLKDYNPNPILTARFCEANTANSTQCTEANKNNPTITRRPDNSTCVWNYSPYVETYYPASYIKGIMWDMTHYDYDDNWFDKSYKYHMDNWVPNIDNGLLKPHNIIAQGLFKGFGYTLAYDPNYSSVKFPNWKGWFPHNLQLKDHTYLAGNAISNDVAVDKDNIASDSDWISIENLKNSTRNTSRLKNIYVCLYNRKRIRFDTSNSRYYYFANTVQNNIVPVIPDLATDDERLSNYKCDLTQPQYTDTTISSVGNIVYTNAAKDWLYFSANLRGNAKESFSMIMQLKPMDDKTVKYEGATKVNEGARFVYWNPCCGPNAFLIVDTEVNVVEATRSDIDIDVEILPSLTTTYKAEIYHLISMKDTPEILRVYADNSYINHLGFGDSSTSVYVGGTLGSKCRVYPGQVTYVKIAIFNNAGFDWNMLGGAIDFNYTGSKPISSNDLMTNFKHTIQAPNAYNFLKLDVPADIAPYITIRPSDHNIGVAPLFFDFGYINVVTIRDGFMGEYYYKITVADTVPESVRGRLWEIKVSVVEKFFDRLPSYNDPTKTGFHDYHLQIPSIKFGIPYSAAKGTLYADKIFYTSGYSTNLVYNHYLTKLWTPYEAKVITPTQIVQFRNVSSGKDNQRDNMRNFFNALTDSVAYTTTTTDATYNQLTFTLSTRFSTFPFAVAGEPDTAEWYLLLRTTADSVPYGTSNIAAWNPSLNYNDVKSTGKTAVISAPGYRTVSAKGAWLSLDYFTYIVDSNYVQKSDQRFFKNDVGIVQVILRITNTGSDIAYNTNFTVALPACVKFREVAGGVKYTFSQNTLSMFPSVKLPPNMVHSVVVYLNYNMTCSMIASGGVPLVPLISAVGSSIDLTEKVNEVTVYQQLDGKYVDVYMRDRDIVTLRAVQSIVNDLPRVLLMATPDPNVTDALGTINYCWFRRVISNGTLYTRINSTYTVPYVPVWENFGYTYGVRNTYDSFIPARTSNYIYYQYEYMVESHDERDRFLAASNVVGFDYNYPTLYYGLIPMFILTGVLILLILLFVLINFLVIRYYNDIARVWKNLPGLPKFQMPSFGAKPQPESKVQRKWVENEVSVHSTAGKQWVNKNEKGEVAKIGEQYVAPTEQAVTMTKTQYILSGSGADLVGVTATALFPFTARGDDEISFKKGDVVKIFNRNDPGWWFGSVDGVKKGLFPSNYVKMLE